jgi:two-component system, OmpR family, KDP operon response regulator KdpE
VNEHILVVDDEPQILRAVERALAARGYDVTTATDGRIAVASVRDAEPDLVVLDLNLPYMDGLTACREIRRTSHTPILVLSVRDAEEDKVAALDLGADDYLTKLVEALASAPGKLRTHRWLLDQVWGPGYDLEVLRVFVSQLRRKLEPDPRHPSVIETDPGVGYRWLPEPLD